MSTETSSEPIVIKKYANRRLYNTATSSYVTLDTLCTMVKAGVEFVVFDAKTGENITKPVLTQIIFEEEAKGQNLLPATFLRQLIRFYGDSLQSLVPNYLEMSMEAFTRNQEQFRTYMTEALGGKSPFSQLEEINKQNMVMFQRAMEMFNPFSAAENLPGVAGALGMVPRSPRAPAEADAEMDALRSQLNALQQRFDAMTSQPGSPRQAGKGGGAGSAAPAGRGDASGTGGGSAKKSG